MDLSLAIRTPGSRPIVREAALPADTNALVAVIREYVSWLDMDLSYRGFDAEMDALGYSTLVFDSVPQTRFAQRIYERLGFVEIEPYYENPIAGTRFLALEL